MTELGFVLQLGVPKETIQSAARVAEEVGYHSFWVNNPPGQDGLTPIAWAAQASTSIRLGTAVVPISHHPPAEILERMNSLSLPRQRYRLGIGSGFGPHPRQRVQEALRALRPAAGCELVVGALGPGMCRLGGEAADAVLLSSLTPSYARHSAELVRQAAEAVGRPAPRVYANVIVGLGAEAKARLQGTAAFLTQLPQYVAHFKRMGAEPIDTLVAAEDASALGERLAAWRGVVDEVAVTPLLSPDRPEEVLEVLDTVRGAWQHS